MAKQFCGYHGFGLFTIIAGLLDTEGKTPDWLQFPTGRAIFTHMARVGIALACALWELHEGDEALVPAYNCGSEISPLLACGLRVGFYRVDEHMRIDLEDLRSRVSPRTRLVYVTHYFGWPQDIDQLAAWCKARGIVLLEDCAHALFSARRSSYLGSVGDAAVFSLPKTLPVPDGGVLVMRDTQIDYSLLVNRPKLAHILTGSLPFLKSRILWRSHQLGCFSVADTLLGRGLRRPRNQYKIPDFADMPASYYFDPKLHRCAVSTLSLRLVRRVDPSFVISRRRENYVALHDGLREVRGIHPLYDTLPEGVCPLALPLLVRDRQMWCDGLAKRSVPAIPWWGGFHRGLSWEGFEEAFMLKTHVLALPIHQDMTTGCVMHIIRCVREIAKTIK
jgi:dTDP-4-amino-4,6-dideoxygalactose transaminase